MELLSDEKVLLTSDTKELTLTTHRIRFRSTSYGTGNLISFMLSELDSCSVVYKSNPILLVLGVILFLLGLIANNQYYLSDIIGFIFVAAVILIIAYIGTRKAVLRISSKNSQININLKSMSLENASKFIDAVEQAKYNFSKR